MTDEPAPQIPPLVMQMLSTVPPEHMEQIAEELLRRLGHGWGRFEIIVEDHHIKEFHNEDTIRAKKPAKNPVNHLHFSQDTV